VHVSGHAAREDHREMIKMLMPANIVPAHGGMDMVSGIAELSAEMGIGKVHMLHDGMRANIG